MCILYAWEKQEIHDISAWANIAYNRHINHTAYIEYMQYSANNAYNTHAAYAIIRFALVPDAIILRGGYTMESYALTKHMIWKSEKFRLSRIRCRNTP